MKLAGIHRHPIKAHGVEVLERVSLAAGETLPGDRRWAVPHERAKLDGTNWVRCGNFTRGATHPSLMAITAESWEGMVTLRHPDRPDLTFDPDAEAERFLDWVAPLIPQGRPEPVGLIRASGQGMTDADRPWLSVHTLASLDALSAEVGQPLSPHRFRGNLWIEGAEAWAENDWIGQTIRIGAAELKVIEPIWRCRATEANPATGHRDADTMGAMTALVEDTTFGVYAEIVTGGEIAVGDPVSV